jgi:cytochrome c-type biogenesis protein
MAAEGEEEEAMEGTVTQERGIFQKLVWPVTLLILALGASIMGAVITGTGTGAVTGGMESLSSSSGNFLSSLSTALPLGFAFGAGMVSAVNPCGFAMLPAYLGMYLGDNEATQRQQNGVSRLRRALLVGSVVTLGFVVLFAVVGITIGVGARPLIRFFPWIGLGIGVLLISAGARLIAGGSVYTALGERLSARMGSAQRKGVRGYFAFGLGYGTASLSCTLPIFLTVVGSTLTLGTIVGSAAQFALYGMGMGLIIVVLTLSMALFQGALVGTMRRALPYIQPVSAVLLLLAGAYIVYYWLTLGELLDAFV